MKRYISIKESFTSTIEFFIQNKKLFMQYNRRVMDFKSFLRKYPESTRILSQIYEEILKSHLNISKSSNNWMKTLITFINDYLNEHDTPMDIMIRNNGDVTINLEKDLPNLRVHSGVIESKKNEKI